MIDMMFLFVLFFGKMYSAIFLIGPRKHMLWVLIRCASPSFLEKKKKINIFSVLRHEAFLIMVF